MLSNLGGNTGTIVANTELQRQTDGNVRRRQFQSHARTKCCGKLDLAVVARLADRLGGILDEIEKNLNELIAIAENRRQRAPVDWIYLWQTGAFGAVDVQPGQLLSSRRGGCLRPRFNA